MQIHGAAVLGGELQDGFEEARRVRVQVRAAADHGGAHLDRVPQHGQPVRAGHPGQQPGYGHGGEVGEPAQGAAGLEHGFHGAEAVHVADADVGADRGGSVAELEQCGLGGPALDLVGGIGDGSLGVGGQRGVPVGVRLGGGGEQ